MLACLNVLVLVLLVSGASAQNPGIGIGPITSPNQQPTFSPAQPPAAIRVDVHLVNVFVNVTDSQGAPVPGLNRDNFSITEDGRQQKIALFDRQSEMPLSIVLAIDTSGSVHKDLSIEQHAAREFIHALLRPVDQLDLIDFSSDVREVVPFTNNLHHLDTGLEHLRSGPATALYDTIFLASQSLAAQPGRKVLVLISDGGDTVRGVDYPRALEQALRSEVPVYSIIDVPIAADPGRNTGGEHALMTLSQQTGGKYYYAESTQLERAFQQVSDDLRTQYLVGYYPSRHSSDPAFRAIDVSLKGVSAPESYTLHHRMGYYPSPPPAPSR